MRVLAVTERWPWPIRTGGQHRLAALLEALHGLGELDLCVAYPGRAVDDEAERALAAERLPGARLHSFPATEHRRGGIRSALRTRKFPWWSPLARFDPVAMRAQVRAAVGPGPFDVVWSYTTFGVPLLDGWGASTRVVDLPELHDVMTTRRSAAASAGTGASSPVTSAADAVRRTIEARAWDRLQQRAANVATIVTVCSEHDREVFGRRGRVEVVPNGYDLPARPAAPGAGGGARTGAPTLVFQGTMSYFPNADAADFFVREALPLLHEKHPAVTLRIVGRAGAEARALAAVDGVTVTGEVEHIEDELRLADVVVVPLRIGSGTRLKILEAWAHGIPVVSTRIGAEGLPAVDGGNLLLADSPHELAAACERALYDHTLRGRLRSGGREAIEAGLQWSDVKRSFASMLAAAASATTGH